jgi:hypothetical protein
MRLLVVALVSFAAIASASPRSGKRSEAVKRFDTAQRYYQQGRYQEALEQLEKGYALEPRPEFLIAIAQAYRGLGRLDEAIARLDRYLAVAKSGPLADRVAAYARELRTEAARKPPPASEPGSAAATSPESTRPTTPEPLGAVPEPSRAAPEPSRAAPEPSRAAPAPPLPATPPAVVVTPVAPPPSTPPRRSRRGVVVWSTVGSTVVAVGLGLGLGLGFGLSQPPDTKLGTFFFK